MATTTISTASLFTEEMQTNLRQRLARLRPDQTHDIPIIVQGVLDGILGRDGEFQRNLLPAERPFVESLLGFWAAQAELLHPSPRQPGPPEYGPEDGSGASSATIKDGVVAVTAAGFALAGLATAVIGVPLALLVGRVLSTQAGKQSRAPGRAGNRTLGEARGINMEQVARAIVNAVRKFLERLDHVLDTHRKELAEAARREEKTFEAEHPLLIGQLQSLLGALHNTVPADVERISYLIQDLQDILSNEGLRAIDYLAEEDSIQHFDVVRVPGLTAPKMQQPAIMRGDVLVRRGRVNLPPSA